MTTQHNTNENHYAKQRVAIGTNISRVYHKTITACTLYISVFKIR